MYFTYLAAISHSIGVNNKSPRSLKHLSAVIPNFNIAHFVPFSCSGGYGTFFLLRLNCRSTDCLIKDSQLGSGLGMSLPLFVFALLLWLCSPSNFCLSCIYIPSSLHLPAHLLCVPHLVCSSHNFLSHSGLGVPLASQEPFRPKIYSLICILTHSVIPSSAQ